MTVRVRYIGSAPLARLHFGQTWAAGEEREIEAEEWFWIERNLPGQFEKSASVEKPKAATKPATPKTK